jgi:hypothetical protein
MRSLLWLKGRYMGTNSSSSVAISSNIPQHLSAIHELPRKYYILRYGMFGIFSSAIMAEIFYAVFDYYAGKDGADLLPINKILAYMIICVFTAGDTLINATLVSPWAESLYATKLVAILFSKKEIFIDESSGKLMMRPLTDKSLPKKILMPVVLLLILAVVPQFLVTASADALAIEDLETEWPTDHTDILAKAMMGFITFLLFMYCFALSGADFVNDFKSLVFDFANSSIANLWRQSKLLWSYASLVASIALAQRSIMFAAIAGQIMTKIFGYSADSWNTIFFQGYIFVCTAIVVAFSRFTPPYKLFLDSYKVGESYSSVNSESRAMIVQQLSKAQKVRLAIMAAVIPTLLSGAIVYTFGFSGLMSNIIQIPTHLPLQTFFQISAAVFPSLGIFALTFAASLRHQMNLLYKHGTEGKILTNLMYFLIACNISSQAIRTLQNVSFFNSTLTQYFTFFKAYPDIATALGLFVGMIVGVLTFMYFQPKLEGNEKALTENIDYVKGALLAGRDYVKRKLFECKNSAAERAPLLGSVNRVDNDAENIGICTTVMGCASGLFKKAYNAMPAIPCLQNRAGYSTV